MLTVVELKHNIKDDNGLNHERGLLMAVETNRNETHQLAIGQAMKALSQLQEKTANDPHRLNYHFMSPAAWINDPNGLIHYRGEYHMFYQIHPYSADNGPKHWGHAKSNDLINWEHLPIALAPVEEYEKNGCFSGTAVDDNGVFTLVYTGNTVTEGIKKQVQCIAVSNDGIVFDKYDHNPVIREFPPEGSVDFRDPKVWKHDDRWYMAIGSGKDGIANALLYASMDLRSWAYIGVMAKSRSTDEGVVWNCPDFFSIGGKDVLLVSPAVWPGNLKDVRKTVYYIGRMDYKTGAFTPEADDDIDWGSDFYAPQTLVDDRGRVILIGWMDMWFNPMPTKAYGWAGAMTIPREVFVLPDGKLGFRPIEELQELREDHRRFESFTLSPDDSGALSGFKGDSLEMMIEFDLSSCHAERFGIKLRQSSDGAQETAITYTPSNRELTVDRSRSGNTAGDTDRCILHPNADNKIKLQLFLDRSSLELFGNDGLVTLTNRIYPDPSSLGWTWFAAGGSVRVSCADVWRLKSIC
jgi:beta-fructofuranosidase